MKTKLILAVIVIILLIFFQLNNDKNKKIQKYLNQQTERYTTTYNANYKKFQEQAHIIFDIVLNKKEVIDIYKKLQVANKKQKDDLRKELYLLLKDDYNKLKYTDLQQLHFHLTSNESFFRFRNPTKFGDDLTKNRESVVFVNKNKKSISGFEIGKGYSGYRFIYPIKDEINTHLGSVEIVFDISKLTIDFMKNYKIVSNFHIKKDIVDKKIWVNKLKTNFTKSPFEDFYMMKNVVKQAKKYNKNRFKMFVVSKEDKKIIQKNIIFDKKFTMYNKKSNSIVTALPVKNPATEEVVAFISIKNNANYVQSIVSNFYSILLITSFLIIIVAFFIYLWIKNKDTENIKLNAKVDNKTKELKVLNDNLKKKVKEEVEKNIAKEMLIFEQSKMANMGLMIGNIAHQWRQPLSIISATASALKVKQELNILKQEDIPNFMDTIVEKTNYLSEIITTFRNFLKEKKELTEVVLQDRIDISLNIAGITLKDNGIELQNNINYDKSIKTTIIAGELTEVLINIINNARDILIEKDIDNPWVRLELIEKNNKAIITIEDNGGGIPDDILSYIFDEYFTTKNEDTGTGLGLYMSYQIITKNLKGEIYAKNTNNGAKFFIELPI